MTLSSCDGAAPGAVQDGAAEPRLPQNLYEVVGIYNVQGDADQYHRRIRALSLQQIQQAYRRQALLCHPDKQVCQGGHGDGSVALVSGPGGEVPVRLAPFPVLLRAAEVLLDPMLREQYNQKYMLQGHRLRGRVSNSDDIVFELSPPQDGDGAWLSLVGPATDTMFGIIEDTIGDGPSSPEGAAWLGLECRCGGYYKLLFPMPILRQLAEQQALGIDRITRESTTGSSSICFRTIHVECESCSLVISVSDVPRWNYGQGQRGNTTGDAIFDHLFL